MERSDWCVVEEAETHGFIRLRVMARRPDAAEGISRTAGHDLEQRRDAESVDEGKRSCLVKNNAKTQRITHILYLQSIYHGQDVSGFSALKYVERTPFSRREL